MSYIDEIDRLIDAGELRRARDLCYSSTSSGANIKLRLAKIVYLEGKYGKAEEICREFPDNIEMQKYLITVLTKQGKFEPKKYDEAIELCKKYINDDIIVKSQYVKILIKQEKYEEAEKMCIEEKENPAFISQLIKAYTRHGKLDEASRICEEHLDEETVKSQYITVLVAQKNIEKAKEICRANPDNVVLQSQLITILMKENKFEEAKVIAEKHVDSDAIRTQLRNINRCIKYNISVNENKERRESREKKENRDSRNRYGKKETIDSYYGKNNKDKKGSQGKKEEVPYINIVKTKIYMDDIPREYIDDLRKSDLDDWQKMISIIAIYKKRKETKNAEFTLKEAKRMFKADPIKLKKLNSLSSYVSSNKAKMFDWNIFDKMTKWEIDEDYATLIRLKREEEASKNEENQESQENKENEKQDKIEEVKEESIISEEQNNEVKVESLTEVAVVELKQKEKEEKEDRKEKEEKEEETLEVIQKDTNEVEKSEVKEDKEETQIPKKVKKNKNKNKEKSKKQQKQENATMLDVYKSEIMKVKAKIANSTNIKEFYVVDNMEEKPATDLRVKMQLVMYLRKYGLDKVASESLPQEYELYDLVNKMMMYKRADSRYDDSKILEEIMDKASKIDGDNEYIYKLLDDVSKKNGEQR